MSTVILTLAIITGLPAPADVQPVVKFQARPFALKDVRLLDGPFRHAQELDRAYLLSLDADRLLHNFRLNAGLPSKAEPLGGWEEPKCELRGHFVGHYLSACALMYASTGDARLKQKGDAVVSGLAECQARLQGGYLSAFPESFIDRVEAGQRVWAPYYTLHKVLAGLLDMAALAGNRQALDTARKFGDWAVSRNARLTPEQMQRMLGNEHGGMTEALANLAAATGDRRYLDTALRFNHQELVGPFSNHVDNLTGKHANTQIPKFIGAAREYELTGDPALKAAAIYFWEVVARERSYVIGGHSDGEMFSPKERLSTAFGPNTTETCNTYNMLKLTEHLFEWAPRAEYADFRERALFNHILASQDPETGGMCYYLPLKPGSNKHYNTPLGDFWCCTGTGVENHAKYGDGIYFHDGSKTLYVGQFIASELDWKDQGVKVRQETKYPDEGASRLTFTVSRPTELSVRVRRPWWVEKGMTVSVNGQPVGPGQADGWLVVDRTWQNGDRLDLSMPMTLRTEGFRDDPRRFALMRGPLVLAAEVKAGAALPVVRGERMQAVGALAPVSGRPITFRASADVFVTPGAEKGAALEFEPLFRIHGERRYVVYFDALTDQQWQAREEAGRVEAARLRAIEARTVDRVVVGDKQSEQSHLHRGKLDSTGPFNERIYRHAPDGWFSWELKVRPGQSQVLTATYWGSDAGREFEVLLDGQALAVERLSGKHPGQFFDQEYAIPAALVEGKDRVTVTFKARPGHIAGGVFGCAVLTAGPTGAKP